MGCLREAHWCPHSILTALRDSLPMCTAVHVRGGTGATGRHCTSTLDWSLEARVSELAQPHEHGTAQAQPRTRLVDCVMGYLVPRGPGVPGRAAVISCSPPKRSSWYIRVHTAITPRRVNWTYDTIVPNGPCTQRHKVPNREHRAEVYACPPHCDASCMQVVYILYP